MRCLNFVGNNKVIILWEPFLISDKNLASSVAKGVASAFISNLTGDNSILHVNILIILFNHVPRSPGIGISRHNEHGKLLDEIAFEWDARIQ